MILEKKKYLISLDVRKSFVSNCRILTSSDRKLADRVHFRIQHANTHTHAHTHAREQTMQYILTYIIIMTSRLGEK